MGEEETDEDEDDDVDEATELANKLKALGYKPAESSTDETKKD
jgi:2-iminoacetate synthase ThiH